MGDALLSLVAHRHRVLLVDDYDDTREVLATVLRRSGCDVETAWGGEDALRHFREGLAPCVVLLDLRMPGVDGWAVWDRMRADERLARLPVVIVSGDVEQRARAHAAGIREFLMKPVEREQLVAAIAAHCDDQRRS